MDDENSYTRAPSGTSSVKSKPFDEESKYLDNLVAAGAYPQGSPGSVGPPEEIVQRLPEETPSKDFDRVWETVDDNSSKAVLQPRYAGYSPSASGISNSIVESITNSNSLDMSLFSYTTNQSALSAEQAEEAYNKICVDSPSRSVAASASSPGTPKSVLADISTIPTAPEVAYYYQGHDEGDKKDVAPGTPVMPVSPEVASDVPETTITISAANETEETQTQDVSNVVPEATITTTGATITMTGAVELAYGSSTHTCVMPRVQSKCESTKSGHTEGTIRTENVTVETESKDEENNLVIPEAATFEAVEQSGNYGGVFDKLFTCGVPFLFNANKHGRRTTTTDEVKEGIEVFKDAHNNTRIGFFGTVADKKQQQRQQQQKPGEECNKVKSAITRKASKVIPGFEVLISGNGNMIVDSDNMKKTDDIIAHELREELIQEKHQEEQSTSSLKQSKKSPIHMKLLKRIKKQKNKNGDKAGIVGGSHPLWPPRQ